MHFQDHEFPLTQADLEMGQSTSPISLYSPLSLNRSTLGAAESATLAIRPPRKGFSAIAPRDSSFFPWFSEHVRDYLLSDDFWTLELMKLLFE